MVDDRQYILLKNRSIERKDWLSLNLANGFVLYYHKDLNVAHDSSNRFVLLGYAWQVVQGKKSPAEILSEWGQSPVAPSRDEIIQEEKTWCGRYLLIADDWIFLDTSGLLGAFYGQDIVSGSLHVVCDALGLEMVYPPIRHRDFPDYLPGFRTPYEGIRRLVPSQILNYVNCSPCFRPMLPDVKIKYADLQEQIDKFSECFITSVRNMRDVFPEHKFLLALTGGYDSRCALSLLHKSGIPFSAFTLWHANITKGDCDIPTIIACIFHLPYKFIKRDNSRFSPEKYQEFQKHTAGMSVDEDWNFHAYGQYRDLLKDDEKIVILRSGVIGSLKNKMEYPSLDIINWLKVFPQLNPDSDNYQALVEWGKSVAHDPCNETIKPWDRIYMDLRSGCWLSSVEQSFDLMEGITSIQPFNCRHILSLVNGFDSNLRKTKLYEAYITEQHMPLMSLVPYRQKYERYMTNLSFKRVAGYPFRRLKSVFFK